MTTTATTHITEASVDDVAICGIPLREDDAAADLAYQATCPDCREIIGEDTLAADERVYTDQS